MSAHSLQLKDRAPYTARCTLYVSGNKSTFNVMDGAQHSSAIDADDEVLLSMKPMGALPHTSAVTWPSDGKAVKLDKSVTLSFKGTVNNPYIEQDG